MRIRKNAKLSPLFFFSSSSSSSSSSAASSSQNGSVPVVTFQTHVCQLNQSPWDVIPFDSDSIQFEVEDSFNAGNGRGRGRGNAGDSIGADESVPTMMDVENKSMMLKIEDVAMVDDDNHDNNHKVAMDDDNGDKGVAKNLCCQSFDGKGWPCKNEAKRGQSICNHHLSLLRSYNNNNNNTPSTKKVAAAIGPRRGGRARAGKKTPSSNSNPYEFYYYSGFGPLWGKRRGDRNGGDGSKNGGAGGENSTESENIDVVGNSNNNAQGVVQMDNNEGFDYEDNDEDDDVNDDNGKKRMRKPVKARSLKSLM